MTFKKAFFLLLFVFSFVTSCRTSRQVAQRNNTNTELIKNDVVTYKDTIIYTPSSETQLKLPVGLLRFQDTLNGNKMLFKPQTFSQKNGNATVQLKIENDTIYVWSKCDSLAIVAQIKHHYQGEIMRLESDLSIAEIRTKGFSVLQAILYSLSCLIIGLAAGIFISKLKII